MHVWVSPARRAGWVVLCLLLGTLGLRAEMTPAITAAELDVAHCTLTVDGAVHAAPTATQVESALGLTAGTGWSSDVVPGKVRHFRVAFLKPVSLGTLYTSFTGPALRPGLSISGAFVSVLKGGTVYPGDVTRDEQWQVLAPGALKTLPPGAQVRALRFSEIVDGAGTPAKATTLANTLLLVERYYNAAIFAHIKQFGAEKTACWSATWNEPRPLVGMLFAGTRATISRVEIIRAESAVPPAIAPASDWKRQPDYAGGTPCYRLAAPLTTRGLRLTAPGKSGEVDFGDIVPLVNLGQIPESPGSVSPFPPYRITYAMPLDGFVTVQIHDKKTGQPVRHFLAEVERKKGPVEEYWDLKDDAGEYVPPGDYEVKTIARPPFKLTYQTTVYNAGTPPWWAPVKGMGSWLADHCPPEFIESAGGKVWIGAITAESGHSVIATDADGKKLWGETWVQGGFTGAQRLAADERYGYVVNNEVIQRIDSQQNFATSFIYRFHDTAELPGNAAPGSPFVGGGGAAVHAGKIYVSYYAPPESWLKPSFTADAIDTSKCMPVAFLAKGGGRHENANDKHYGNGEYDEIMRVCAAFLTERSPTNTATLKGANIPCSRQAYFGDAPKEGPLAGTLTLALRWPAPVGSVVVPDARIKVYALKAGLELPDGDPDTMDPEGNAGGGPGGDATPFDDTKWVPLPVAGTPGQPGVALTPKGGLTTKALRFQTDRLIYALVSGHRFTPCAQEAERVCQEGVITRTGGWQVGRPADRPITGFDPPAMALVWKTPTLLRGVSISFPGTGAFAVDRWIGPDTGDPQGALTDDAQWRVVSQLRPQPAYFMGQLNFPTVYNVDFGATIPVRAVRVRAVVPSGGFGEFHEIFVSGAQSAEFKSIMAYTYLGDDPVLPVAQNERISELALPGDGEKEATLLRQIPVKQPGNLTFDAAGTLYAISGNTIVTVPLDGEGQPKEVVSAEKLEQPGDLAVDGNGLLYVTDCGPKIIKVFDSKDGTLVRTIGHAGGLRVGKWDPLRFDLPTGITLDDRGKLWVADCTYQPKRVARLTRDGQVEQEYLGPTEYGGGGRMDAGNHAVVNYNGMKFVIDWKDYSWKLEGILFKPGASESLTAATPDRAIYVQGRRYLVNSGRMGGAQVVAICTEKDDFAVPLAAMGALKEWGDIDARPALRKAFGKLQRSEYRFLWSDTNGDGQPQPEEVQLSATAPAGEVTVGEDLTIYCGNARFRPTGFTTAGGPLYDLRQPETIAIEGYRVYGLDDGRYFTIGDHLYSADGKTELWAYHDKYDFHEGFYAAGFGSNRPPGVLVQLHSTIGHFRLNGEEFIVANSDGADWPVFTGDGMLLGCIFGGPAGYGLRAWSMPEALHNVTDLSDVRPGQEHYGGQVVKAEDGKVYAIAGHNHVSIVLVEGLERLQRLPVATVAVSPTDLTAAQTWTLQTQTLEHAREEPKVAKLPFIPRAMTIDGELSDWPDELFMTIHDYWQRSFMSPPKYILHTQGALAYDEQNLYVALRTIDSAPMANTAQDLQKLFKFGAAIDVTLGLAANADPARKQPVTGDVRLLISEAHGKPVVVIYHPVAPGVPADKHVRFVSPVAQTDMDMVTVIEDANVAVGLKDPLEKWHWMAEAAIPWKAIGLAAPKIGTVIRGDIGVLLADDNGVHTSQRLYWSGKAQTMVCDLAGEARLFPSLWGELLCAEPDAAMRFGPGDVDTGGGAGAEP